MSSPYQPPLRDMHFALHELADFAEIAKLPGYEDAAENADAVLEAAADFAQNVLEPMNQIGDKIGAKWDNGNVTMPKGFKEVYKQFAEQGWIGLPMPTEYGGQNLPQSLSTATLEMWNASGLGFSLGPLLNQGAIEAILLVGNEAQKQKFVPKLVSGEWTGTMVLTEPQAGSDLALVKTKAVPEGDHYRITGSKIYITYGEHDMTDNIIHLVLARTPDAPEGVKGISLFIVPKNIVNEDGSLGEHNDVHCASIEHKMGIHASPTAVLNYGEKKGGAIGYLMGEENKGLSYMFIMMNLARFSVGVQGIAVADRAYQMALHYSKERIQGKDLSDMKGDSAAIIRHPDVRRMLMQCKSTVEAMRALAFWTGAQIDIAHASPDPAAKKAADELVELFTPIVKGWSTEASLPLVSTALQVFGGMGFVEETGIAQLYRDARITPIYEGTTAIQANDLVGRKFLKDQGKVVMRVVGQMNETVAALEASPNDECKAIGAELKRGVGAITESSMWLGGNAMKDLKGAFAGSVPYLMLWGTVAGGWMMAKAALISAEKTNDPFYAAKLVTSRFYADHVLPMAQVYKHEITKGSASTLGLDEEAFDLDKKSLAMA